MEILTAIYLIMGLAGHVTISLASYMENGKLDRELALGVSIALIVSLCGCFSFAYGLRSLHKALANQKLHEVINETD